MPLSANDYEKGNIVEGSSKIILNFLRSRPDQAFTQDEIIKGVNPDPTPESFIDFLAAMAPLQFHGLVERREIPMRDGSVDVRRINEPLTEEIRSTFPQNEFNFTFLRQVYNDLSSRGFVKVELVSQSDEGEVVTKAKITLLGRDFLRFISN